MVQMLEIDVSGQGLHAVTERVQVLVEKSGLEEGLCTLLIQHTSASLVHCFTNNGTFSESLAGQMQGALSQQ